MKKRGREKKPPTPGTLELKVPFGDYASLFAVGLFAALPVTTWLTALIVPLGDHRIGNGPLGAVLGVIFVVAVLSMLLVAPWLVPILVLRARQPRGARIAWDDTGVTEWDGSWRRSTIAWSELEAGRQTWETKIRARTHVDEALQLVGPPPAAAITVWTTPPAGVPHFRRRLCADPERVAELREAIQRRGISMTREPDWVLACDSDRPPHRTLTIVGRFGYPFATLAPIITPASHGVGVAMAVTAAALLAARALPSLREVRAIMARGKERADLRAGAGKPQAADAAEEPGGYREAAAPSDDPPAGAVPEQALAEDDARATADRSKLRAALVEAVVRVGCIVLLAASTAAALFLMH